jgi:hypothetical protein
MKYQLIYNRKNEFSRLFGILESEFFVVFVDKRLTALGQLAKEDFLSQGVADFFHDQAPEGPCTVIGIIAFLGQIFTGLVGKPDVHPFFGQLLFQLSYQFVNNPFRGILVE